MSLIRSWAAAVRRLAMSCRRWRRALRLSRISCLKNSHQITEGTGPFSLSQAAERNTLFSYNSNIQSHIYIYQWFRPRHFNPVHNFTPLSLGSNWILTWRSKPKFFVGFCQSLNTNDWSCLPEGRSLTFQHSCRAEKVSLNNHTIRLILKLPSVAELFWHICLLVKAIAGHRHLLQI